MTPQDKYQKIMEVMTGTKIVISDTHRYIGTHPLRLGDVLDWIEKNPIKSKKAKINQYMSMKPGTLAELTLSMLWKDKRLPLSPTNEELVDYIYSLIA